MTSLKRPLEVDFLNSNISSKVFVRSTKNGRVQKIVREVYLRRDIPCSSRLCSQCLENAPASAKGAIAQFILSQTPARTKSFPLGHYLVPDTNVLLNGMDLFEETSGFYDVIILQTVLEELRNRSLPLYNRLMGLTKSKDKHFYVFFNEFRLETHVVRDSSESINDRNDRAVRRAVSWYVDHLQKVTKGQSRKPPSVVMLSDDKENLRKAEADKLDACSLIDYVSGLEDSEHLLDMINSTRQDRGKLKIRSEMLYPEYFPKSKLLTGVRTGTLHQGIFNVSPYNYLEGSIQVPAFSRSLLILGRENSNRAIQGDVVVIEVLPKLQWKSPSTKIIQEEVLNKNDNPDPEEAEPVVTEQERRALQDEVKKSHQQSKEGQAQPTARVVGIIKRNWRQYVGHIDLSSSSAAKQVRKQQTLFLIPMDKRVPKIRIQTRQGYELIGKRLVVTIDSWDEDSRYPVGHFVRSLGDLEAKGAETEALLLEYDVQYRPFAQVVLDCLPHEGHDWKVPADLNHPGWKGRKDLRDLLVCSIDPVGCQDIDDALHARLLSNGNFEVGVHIADVSYFVKPNNAMDAEASTRGTTVYLVDKRIDMLPMLLGTDLCSLKPYVERYAFSIIWQMTKAADVISVSYSKSVIRSRKAFSYEEAQIRIDDSSYDDDLTRGMRTLLALSKVLHQKRMMAGALNLASPEVRIQTESEISDPVDVKTKELLDTNSLVEEFMLLANITVASKIYSAFPQYALLRRHAAPPKTNFDELTNQLQIRRGIKLHSDTSKALANSLDNCIDPTEPFFNTLVRMMATRCMMSAEYFPSGTQSYPEFRHYGLASEIYTHFTSPIRRYADLVVHRQLAAAIGYEPGSLSLTNRSKLEEITRNLNVRHRNAQMAGRASIEYFVGQALKGRVLTEESFVIKIFSNGVVVFVPRFGIEGMMRLKDLGADEKGTIFDVETYVLSITVAGGKKKGTQVQVGLFDRIAVKIRDVLEESTGKRKVGMEMVW